MSDEGDGDGSQSESPDTDDSRPRPDVELVEALGEARDPDGSEGTTEDSDSE